VPPLLEARLHRKILQTIWEMKYRSDFATWEALAQTHAALRSRLEALLQRLAGEAPQPEQVRLLVILSHDAAELTQPPDWTTAERYAQAAVSIAEQLDEPGELSAALDALDVVYLGRGLLRERVAVTLRRLALSSDRRLTDLRERGAILAKAGSALRDVGEYAQALVHLQEAEQLAQQLQATSMQVDALTAQSLCWLRLDRWDEVLKIDAERHDLEQRYSGEQMGATCAIGALAATAHALRGERAAATAKREQAYDFMVGTAGPTERWTRGQHY
jgi:tetratricopeptide (TPR) repeat protein